MRLIIVLNSCFVNGIIHRIKYMKKGNLIYVFLVALLIIIGAYLRLDNLGKINFQNDEFFHVTTAKGYLETKTFVMWDFLENKSTGDYIRAFPYTWLVAQSFRFIGISEFSGRLPSAIFGILLLPFIYYIAYKITGNKLIALLSLLLITFDNSFIWSSRICRMYSMFVFFAMLASYLLFKGMEGKNKKFNYYYLVPGIILFLFSYLIHEATLLLGLGYLVYFFLNFQERRFKLLAILSFATLVIFLIIHFFIHPLTTNEFFTIRTHPNFIYFLYPFNQLHLGAAVGWLVIMLGIFLWEKKFAIKIYYLSMFLPVILFFVFIGERYAAKKYLLFLIPFILILFLDSFYLLLKRIISQKNFIYYFVIILIFFGPIYSWPGIAKNLYFQPARADENYQNAKLHNFIQAYKYIENNYLNREPIVIQGRQSYYFSRHDLNFISLKANKEFTVADLQKIITENNSGWVVWTKYKEKYHVNDQVVKHCEENLQFVKDLEDTNMLVYRW